MRPKIVSQPKYIATINLGVGLGWRDSLGGTWRRAQVARCSLLCDLKTSSPQVAANNAFC